MDQLNKFEQIFRKWMSLVMSRGKIIPVIIIALLLFFVLRSCSIFSPHHHKVYYIGRDSIWYPLNLMGKEKLMTAFSDDLLLAIAKTEGLRFRLGVSSTEHLVDKLETEEFDGILSSLQPTPQNRNMFIFSDPYFQLGTVLVVPITSEIDTWDEMSGKTIGIQTGSILAFEATRKYPSIQIRPYNTFIQALADLENAAIDGALLPALPAYIYVKTFYPETLKVATLPLTNEALRLVVLKNDDGKELVDYFNAGLKLLKENGAYSRLIEQWGLIETDKPKRTSSQ